MFLITQPGAKDRVDMEKIPVFPPNFPKASNLSSVYSLTSKWWVCVCVCVLNSLQLCPILYSPVNCSPPGSSVQGILQAGILEWVAMPSSRGSSPCRDFQLHWQLGSLPSHLGSPSKWGIFPYLPFESEYFLEIFETWKGVQPLPSKSHKFAFNIQTFSFL